MKNKLGFTLVEMLTVVLIIGILTAVALPQYRRAIEKARYTEAVHMLRVIYDSSERLAVSSGYRNFAAMQTALDERADFAHMDMFNADAMACSEIENGGLVCGNFEYHLGEPGMPDVISAMKTGQENADRKTMLFLHRGDVPTITCQDSYQDNRMCDSLNLPLEGRDSAVIDWPVDDNKETSKTQQLKKEVYYEK